MRVAGAGHAAAKATLTAGSDAVLGLVAANPGAWGNELVASIAHDDDERFALTIEFAHPGGAHDPETHSDLTIDEDDSRFVGTVLAGDSDLARLDADGPWPLARPDERDVESAACFSGGSDGDDVAAGVVAPDDESGGLYALRASDGFNLLCLTPWDHREDVPRQVWEAAAALCEQERAILLVDAPKDRNAPEEATAFADELGLGSARRNAALYVPWLETRGPVGSRAPVAVPPAAAVAGICARVDRHRGVWKAPAGQDATVRAITGLAHAFSEEDIGELTQAGVNAIRTLRGSGTMVWGARTLAGAQSEGAGEWRYLPIRRLALFVEDSLERGLSWTAFEPNDEPLWQQIRQACEAFLQSLFEQGALMGDTSQEAFFVRCDETTTTPDDVAEGRVHLEVGLAATRPAEFVVVKLALGAGEPPA